LIGLFGFERNIFGSFALETSFYYPSESMNFNISWIFTILKRIFFVVEANTPPLANLGLHESLHLFSFKTPIL
jgi:hypothetical protein